MNLYTKYHFHQCEFGEYTTEYKGYRIEIAFDEKYNRYEADAFDLEAQEYVFYPCTKIRNKTLEHVIEVVIARINKKKNSIMEKVLNIPEITNNTIQYFVDDEFVGNVTVDQVNQIRENAINYIIENKDKSILDKFYFVGHRDSNDKPREEIKITMDAWGNFSDLPWEMNHVRRSMMRLMQIERKNCELLNSLNN